MAMAETEGKESFYPKVGEALTSMGYEVFDQIRGKGRSHSSKPDYIAIKGSTIVIGEIKSPSEGPLTASWRVSQSSDTKEFAAVRHDVERRERQGLLFREVGGHEIIIRGQIPDYIRKLGTTYDLPAQCTKKGPFTGGYSAPYREAKNIEQAFLNCGKNFYEKLSHKNGTVTYIFYL
jgi:hypothetical protein